VLGRQSIEQPTKRSGKGLIGRDIRTPKRVAAARRQDSRREDSAERRRLDKGDVGVPIVIVGEITGAGLDRGDLGDAVNAGVDGMNMQLAEAGGEVPVSGRVQRLAFKEQHVPLGERGSEPKNSGVR
jgi:hypothetical protein